MGHRDRCKIVVEPRLSLQWFVKIQPLADSAPSLMMVQRGPHPLHAGDVREDLPELDGEHPRLVHLATTLVGPSHSCMALQPRATRWTVAREDPAECWHCVAPTRSRRRLTCCDTVVLFGAAAGALQSSATASNITPENRADFDTFYPTSLLVTGFDILFFWVARMIMLGCWFAADVPMPDENSKRELAKDRRAVQGCIPYPRAGARREPRKDVQDQGERSRSHRDREAVRHRRGPLYACVDGFARH